MNDHGGPLLIAQMPCGSLARRSPSAKSVYAPLMRRLPCGLQHAAIRAQRDTAYATEGVLLGASGRYAAVRATRLLKQHILYGY